MKKCNMSYLCRFLSVLIIPVLISCGASQSIKSSSANVARGNSHVSEFINTLSARHYKSRRIDDQFSIQLHNALIAEFDEDKVLFTLQEIEGMSADKLNLDDGLRAGNIDIPIRIYKHYINNEITRINFLIGLMERKDSRVLFNTGEIFKINRAEESFPSTLNEQQSLWINYLRLKIVDLVVSGKTYAESAAIITMGYKRDISRLSRVTEESVDETIFNVITQLYDPHTKYWAPRTTEKYNINLALGLEGVGVVFEENHGDAIVVRSIPGGAASRSGRLRRGDKIVGVGEGKGGDVQSTMGMSLEEVVDMVRGPSKTTVKLEVLSGLQRKIVLIERGRVHLEDQGATKKVIDIDMDGTNYKVGVIDLDTFYVDFEAMRKRKHDFKSSANDVTRLVRELKEEGIDGLIIDLRNNGGGSLREAILLADIFVDSGPIVQIRDKDGRINRHNRSRSKALYLGPLAVLINRRSAGSSEIFAAAIQDYQRGLIVGSQSFGMGAVQSINPLSRGGLKITESKYYRITGNSFQNKGVTPDIKLPSMIDHSQVGESTYPNALESDELFPVPFTPSSNLTVDIPRLQQFSAKRIQLSSEYSYLNRWRHMKKMYLEADTVVLDSAARMRDIEKYRNDVGDIDNRLEKMNEGLLKETGNVLVDYIHIYQQRK